MKLRKKFIMTVSALVMTTTLIPTVGAQVEESTNSTQMQQTINYGDFYSEKDFEIKTNEDLDKIENSLDTMTIKELNAVINYASQVETINSTDSITTNSLLGTAWKAAAQIARISGYPLAATLVEHSVDGNNYSETDGAFATEIKTTNVYSNITSGSGSNSFTNSDNSDLYYAIHAFDYTNSGNTLTITDVFDFALNTNYQNLFSTLVNNWGYLNQNLGVLTPINVTIDISK
jgi:hypothetical protein